MSNYYGSIEMKTAIIKNVLKKEDVDNALLELCDDDFNGNNGEEYVSEKAKNSGYDSDFDWYVNTTEFDSTNTNGWLDYVKGMLEIMNSYCEWGMQCETICSSDGTVSVFIAVAMI